MEQSEAIDRRRTDNTMTKRQSANNDVQNITEKTLYGVTRTPLKPGVNSGASSCSTCGNCRFTLVTSHA